MSLFYASKKEEKVEKIQDQLSETMGQITFSLTKNFNVEVLCKFPELDSNSLDNLTTVAEKYAELIVYINNGYFHNKLISLLKNRSKITDDPNETLLIDNIITFHSAIKKELNKVSSFYSKPLIPPSSAFIHK